MINFPVLGGTSGHLLGGTLAGILLGPWAGTLVMFVVFMVQALLFQDGGITALGANVLNMGFIGTFVGYYLYRTIRFTLGAQSSWAMFLATGIASWLSVLLAAVSVAYQLAWSGTVGVETVLLPMVGVHILIGLGEAVLTVAVVSFLWRTRPDLLFDPPSSTKRSAP
jgi:cobalt/nickel transport system permease protein